MSSVSGVGTLDLSIIGLMIFELISGQGYLWMVHKTPSSEKWELAMRSKRLWEMLAESIENQGMDPLDVLGWKRTGNLIHNFMIVFVIIQEYFFL